LSAHPQLAQLDFVVPDLFDTSGGIARISCAMSLALCHWAERHDIRLCVHVLLDQGGRRKAAYLPEPHEYRTYDGDRAHLARALLARTWRAPGQRRAVVFAHPNLAVLGLAFPPWSKIAVVAHGIDVWTRLRLERRLALRRADIVWPVSEDTAAHLVRNQGVSPTRIKVIHNALDPLWPLPPNPVRSQAHLLAVSRLHPEHTYKGIDLTLQAIARLAPNERPPFVIAGQGPDQARLQALASQLDLDVTFPGRVSDARLAELFQGARAFVLPSSGEGFGLVYLEAMAFALPCIAARAGGSPEVVKHDLTGVVIPPGDIDALTLALRRVLSDEGRRMGLAGRALVEREFLFSMYESRVHAALDALLA